MARQVRYEKNKETLANSEIMNYHNGTVANQLTSFVVMIGKRNINLMCPKLTLNSINFKLN